MMKPGRQARPSAPSADAAVSADRQRQMWHRCRSTSNRSSASAMCVEPASSPWFGAMGAELGHHQIVEHRDPEPSVTPLSLRRVTPSMVPSSAAGSGESIAADRGRKFAVGIPPAIEPAFDAPSPVSVTGSSWLKRSFSPAAHPDHLLDQVDSGDQSVNQVLDLADLGSSLLEGIEFAMACRR